MELQHFLDQAGQAGSYDSSDEFTLDTLASSSKLSRHQLPEPGLWLVRLVQGAVALDVVGGIRIEFGRRQVKMAFRTRRGPSAEELLRALFSGSLFADPALNHLVCALRASAADSNEHIEWFVSQQGQGERICLSRDGLSRSPASFYGSGGSHAYEILVRRPPPAMPLKKALRKRVVDLVKEVADEYSALVSRCWCAPVPIEIDGHPLAPSIPHPKMRHLTDCEQVGCPVDRYHLGDQWLAWRPLTVKGPRLTRPAQNPPGEPVGDGQAWRANRIRAGECFLQWATRPESNAGLLVSFAAVAPPGIDFLSDGAVVDTYNLPYVRPLQGKEKALLEHQRQAASFRLFLPVGQEQLDLSGFQLRNKEQLASQFLSELGPVIRETLDTLAEELPHYHFSPTPNPLLETCLAPFNWWNNQYTKDQIQRTLRLLQDFLSGR